MDHRGFQLWGSIHPQSPGEGRSINNLEHVSPAVATRVHSPPDLLYQGSSGRGNSCHGSSFLREECHVELRLVEEMLVAIVEKMVVPLEQCHNVSEMSAVPVEDELRWRHSSKYFSSIPGCLLAPCIKGRYCGTPVFCMEQRAVPVTYLVRGMRQFHVLEYT
ncbi:hypothetical protein GWK47_012676 [Chionoecetes opilio]|uniref:Uncharacterized protein n=1 Tax=Chionoecetes opilio TaxID=41210 RepID=A0A8J4XVY7_CHIOP|nr:hypothetical protein GWK47_012676 [Chionoecetes opilio]